MTVTLAAARTSRATSPRSLIESSSISRDSIGPFRSSSAGRSRLKRAFVRRNSAPRRSCVYCRRRLAVAYEPDERAATRSARCTRSTRRASSRPRAGGRAPRRSYGPRRLQRTSCCGGATVEIGSIWRKPSCRTVSRTSRRRAVEELRAYRDPAGFLRRNEPHRISPSFWSRQRTSSPLPTRPASDRCVRRASPSTDPRAAPLSHRARARTEPTVTNTVVRMIASPGSASSSSSSSAKTIEAAPRGPNQPRKATVGRRAPVPSIAIATGSIRTRVRLSTA